jgi:hypothetical protein
MKIYLSARFDRKQEMQEIRKKIEDYFNHGGRHSHYVEVNSRWLDEDTYPTDPDEQQRFLRDRAFMDKIDVFNCDVLARFSDDLNNWGFLARRAELSPDLLTNNENEGVARIIPAAWGTGARMEETGMAEAWGKTIVIVGGKKVFSITSPPACI